jgi:hypothetical protein
VISVTRNVGNAKRANIVPNDPRYFFTIEDLTKVAQKSILNSTIWCNFFQGDQIGRIFTHWVIVFFGLFSEVAHILGLLFPLLRLFIGFDKNVLGDILSDFFHKLFWPP